MHQACQSQLHVCQQSGQGTGLLQLIDKKAKQFNQLEKHNSALNPTCVTNARQTTASSQHSPQVNLDLCAKYPIHPVGTGLVQQFLLRVPYSQAGHSCTVHTFGLAVKDWARLRDLRRGCSGQLQHLSHGLCQLCGTEAVLQSLVASFGTLIGAYNQGPRPSVRTDLSPAPPICGAPRPCISTSSTGILVRLQQFVGHPATTEGSVLGH